MFVVVDKNGWFVGANSTEQATLVTQDKNKAMLFATKEKAQETASWLNYVDPFTIPGSYTVREMKL